MLTLLPLDTDAALRHHPGLTRIIVDTAADSIFVMDAEGRTVFMNPAATRTFGWTLAEIADRKLHDVIHYRHLDGSPFPMDSCPLGQVFASRTTIEKHEDVFFHRDGSAVHVTCSNAPILKDGEVVGAVLVVVDVTERKGNELKLAAALAEKEALLRQQEMLVREVHHRVKNSLQLVSSLLSLQIHELADPAARARFEQASRRVETIARLHRNLYRTANVATVAFGPFLRELCADIAQLGDTADRIRLHVEAGDVELATDQAVPLALIANELLTNAVKYAFPDGRAGSIHVHFTPWEEGWELRVRDDGVGLPPDFQPGSAQTLGMRILMALAEQTRSQVTFGSAPGTDITVRLPFSQ